ncbi:MAG TPA: helix-turn-helix domain-containing protein [Armatimonadota bacterium]
MASSHKESFPRGFEGKGILSAWALAFVLHGQYEVLMDTDAMRYEDGSILLQKPGILSRWRVPQDCEELTILWFIFQPYPHWRNMLVWPEVSPGYASVRLDNMAPCDKITGALLQAHELLNSHWENRVGLAMNALESALLWCQTIVKAQCQPLDPRVEAAVAYIMHHVESPIRMDDIVTATCLSRSRLNQLFTRETGMPVMAFLERERMRRAVNLLTLTSRSIKEIAQIVGYDDPCHFSRRFSLLHGKSPQAYRLGPEPGIP